MFNVSVFCRYAYKQQKNRLKNQKSKLKQKIFKLKSTLV